MRFLTTFAAVVAAQAAVQLTANTSSVSHLDRVLVTATGLTPGAAYWMGIFYPANASVVGRAPMPYPATAPWTENAPAEYVDVNAKADGTANFTWTVVNALSDDLQVWIFSGSAGDSTVTALAGTGPIKQIDADAPMRGHIARMTDPSTIRVVWNSRHNDDNPTVQFGTAPGIYTNTVYAESFTYGQDDLCGEPATTHGWYWSGHWHYAQLHNLSVGTNTIYYYRFGSEAHGWSEEKSFKSVPAPGSPVKMLLCADMGVSTFDQPATDHWAEPDASETIAHMRDWATSGTGYDWSFILHSGDVSYATGYQLKWALYLSALEGLADRVPYNVNLGNHERDFPGTGTHYDTSVDSGGECGVATQIRFPTPVAGAAPYKDLEWYSFTHGNTLVIMIGTEMEVGPGSSQYIFLSETLAAADRNVTPWIVVAGHRPMYMVDDSANGGSIDANFQAFEPLLMQYQVDLVLWGHVHNAYATCPVYKGECVTTPQPNGYLAPVHVSIGNAGQGLSPINNVTYPKWVDFQGAYWGYSTWESFNSTNAVVNLYQNAQNCPVPGPNCPQKLVYSVPLQKQ